MFFFYSRKYKLNSQIFTASFLCVKHKVVEYNRTRSTFFSRVRTFEVHAHIGDSKFCQYSVALFADDCDAVQYNCKCDGKVVITRAVNGIERLSGRTRKNANACKCKMPCAAMKYEHHREIRIEVWSTLFGHIFWTFDCQ